MRRIWIHFTERQATALQEDALSRRVPMSEIVRGLISQHYGLEAEKVEMGRPYKSPEIQVATDGG